MVPRLVFIFTLLFFSSAQAAWMWNVAYNNPPGAAIGGNIMLLETDWAFEGGVGGIYANGNSLTVLGDVNVKYLFLSGWFRPYAQAGFGATVSASGDPAAGASLAGPFGGAGIFMLGSPFYIFASYNYSGSGFFQGGLGFPF